MNNRINFTELGGFPMTQFSLAFMQDSYRNAFTALAFLIGDKTILSGMVEAGGNVSSGWIAVGGEIMPFIGGTLGAEILIEEIKDRRVFQDGISKEVYYTKQARFGSPGGILYSDFTRLATLLQLLQHTEDDQNPHKTTLPQVGYNASDNPDGNKQDELATTVATKVLANRIKIVGSGIYNIGDVPAGDPVFTVTHNLNLTPNYLVFGSIMSTSNPFNNNTLTWAFFDRFSNSFKVTMKELDGEQQSVVFAWMIVKL